MLYSNVCATKYEEKGFIQEYENPKMISLFLQKNILTVNLVLVRTAKNNYFSLCTN